MRGWGVWFRVKVVLFGWLVDEVGMWEKNGMLDLPWFSWSESAGRWV